MHSKNINVFILFLSVILLISCTSNPNPGTFLPDKCRLQPGIDCNDHKSTYDQIELLLVNGIRHDLSSIIVTAENCGSTNTPSNLINGATGQFTIKCNPKLSGNKYKGEINVSYKTSENGISHVNSGELIAVLK